MTAILPHPRVCCCDFLSRVARSFRLLEDLDASDESTVEFPVGQEASGDNRRLRSRLPCRIAFPSAKVREARNRISQTRLEGQRGSVPALREFPGLSDRCLKSSRANIGPARWRDSNRCAVCLAVRIPLNPQKLRLRFCRPAPATFLPRRTTLHRHGGADATER